MCYFIKSIPHGQNRIYNKFCFVVSVNIFKFISKPHTLTLSVSGRIFRVCLNIHKIIAIKIVGMRIFILISYIFIYAPDKININNEISLNQPLN